MQCHVEIRIFDAKCKVKFSKVKLTSQKANCTLSFCSLAILLVFVLLMLLVCHDTELNPGPRKRDTCYNLSIFHWNSNSVDVHNLEKVIFLEVYNTVNRFDKICLSAMYLDSSILYDNYNLVIKGYKLVRVDHPDHIKRGGDCA